MLGRGNKQPAMFNFSDIEKWQTISTSQSLSDTFALVFYAQYLTFWEHWLKVILSCHFWESIEITVLLYGFWGEPCLTQIGILKRFNNFKCVLPQRRKLFAQSTPKIRKVTVAKFEFRIKHWLTWRINQCTFKKQFENTNRGLIKFTRSVMCFKSIFKFFGNAYLANAYLANPYRWRTQGVEMMCSARLFTRVVKPDFMDRRSTISA